MNRAQRRIIDRVLKTNDFELARVIIGLAELFLSKRWRKKSRAPKRKRRSRVMLLEERRRFRRREQRRQPRRSALDVERQPSAGGAPRAKRPSPTPGWFEFDRLW